MQRAVLAGVRPVQVPVPGHLAKPALVVPGHNSEAADRALATVLVAVEKVDRERPALGQSAQKPRTQRVIDVTDRAFPQPSVGRRDIEIDGQAAEVRGISMGVGDEGRSGIGDHP